MTLPIRLYTDPILRTPTKPVTDFADPTLEPLVQEMLTTMQANNGVGLAANQVGVDKSICVMHLENRTKILVVVNPLVISFEKKKKIKLNEGCLSCPGLSVEIRRPRKMTVMAQTLTGDKVMYEFTDYDARIACHELGHLVGVTIADVVQKYAVVS